MEIPSLIRSRFRFAGDLTRAAEVAKVLAKYGLAGWFVEIEWGPIHNAIKTAEGQALGELPFPVRLRMALTELGTTFIKLGQMLSTRPGLVGEEVAAELEKLRDSAPPDPPEVAREMVEKELGRPIHECFKKFEGEALASASVGQVHRATLKSGRRVAVKVQHPGIEGTVRRDLDVLKFLAEVAERSEQIHHYEPVALVKEFSRTTLNELDFRRELRNLQAFRRNFANDPTIAFPRAYPHHSTGRVLTMQFMHGTPVSDTDALDKMDLDRAELARRGANIYVEMIFRDGFYHADPHPGNIMILRDGRFGLLDAGMVGRIDDIFRKQIEDVLMAAGDRDSERLSDAVVRMCGHPKELDRVRLAGDLSEFFQEFGTQTVGRFDVSGALTEISKILTEHRLVMPGRLTMLIKCLILLENTGRLLSPDFSLAEVLAPWRDKYVRRRLSPWERLKHLRKLYQDWERTIEALPRMIMTVFEKAEHGKMVVHLEHRHLKSAANRLVVGLFISSLLIASAVLIHTHMPPMVWGVSFFGAGGYLLAVVFGFRMLWVNRDRRVSHRDGDWD